MSDFKYEVGDMFDLGTRLNINTRRIEARFKSEDGENKYVVRYFRNGKAMELIDSPDEIQTERYISDMYTKIEPFFKVGKKYIRNGLVVECIETLDYKQKYALMLFEDESLGLRTEDDFDDYAEI